MDRLGKDEFRLHSSKSAKVFRITRNGVELPSRGIRGSKTGTENRRLLSVALFNSDAEILSEAWPRNCPAAWEDTLAPMGASHSRTEETIADWV